MILLYKMLHFPYCTEVLSAVHMYKRLVMCLMEKIHVSDKLQSGMSHGAVGHEFNVNESAVY